MSKWYTPLIEQYEEESLRSWKERHLRDKYYQKIWKKLEEGDLRVNPYFLIWRTFWPTIVLAIAAIFIPFWSLILLGIVWFVVQGFVWISFAMFLSVVMAYSWEEKEILLEMKYDNLEGGAKMSHREEIYADKKRGQKS